jgi:hypothetical protein
LFKNVIIAIETRNSRKEDVSMNITIIGRKCNPREDFRSRAEKRVLKVEKQRGGCFIKCYYAQYVCNYSANQAFVLPEYSKFDRLFSMCEKKVDFFSKNTLTTYFLYDILFSEYYRSGRSHFRYMHETMRKNDRRLQKKKGRKTQR